MCLLLVESVYILVGSCRCEFETDLLTVERVATAQNDAASDITVHESITL